MQGRLTQSRKDAKKDITDGRGLKIFFPAYVSIANGREANWP